MHVVHIYRGPNVLLLLVLLLLVIPLKLSQGGTAINVIFFFTGAEVTCPARHRVLLLPLFQITKCRA